MTVTSALNAIAHAAEGLYAHDGNPITSLMAEEGIRASARGAASLCREPEDLDARGDALYGAWLCGAVLGAVAWGCTTSSATRWAAASTCRTPRRTP